jgi:peptidoglycan hydrolase CwlO-like protein
VSKAVDYVQKITNENKLLKDKLETERKRIDELEVLIERFKADQDAIEDGIRSALKLLSEFDDEAAPADEEAAAAVETPAAADDAQAGADAAAPAESAETEAVPEEPAEAAAEEAAPDEASEHPADVPVLEEAAEKNDVDVSALDNPPLNDELGIF